MEREPSPDWLRDFKSPTEDFLMILSSSPSSSSRELAQKVSTKEYPELNSTNEVEEDSPLVNALDGGNAVKGTQSKEGTPRRRGRPPGKNQKNRIKSPVKKEETLEDDDEEDEKVISSRRSRGGKRLVDSDEDDEEFKPPTKSRKTAPSPKVKKEGTKSSRKNKRVSITEDEEPPSVKRVKREIQLEPIETAAIKHEDDDDETAPISKLSSLKKTAEQPAPEPPISGSASVAESSKDRPGTNALRALVEDEALDEDGFGFSQKEDPVAAETGEPSERRQKRISSTLPVIFADKIHRTKVLLECEDDALDLSGDMGAVGRFSATGRSDGEDELFLDLKGVVYKSTIVPSNTFFVVNIGQTEAKVEAVMTDFMQLRPDVNPAGDETVVEGTLEDFGFDLDNDGDGGAGPNSTPAPGEADDEEDEGKPKKKSPTKGLGKKAAAVKGAKAKAKPAGKGSVRKPRVKAKKPRKPRALKG